MKENEEYIVDIIDEDNIGNGIARINNFVVFIKNALLDEKIKIKIIKITKSYAIGRIIEIIVKSDKRTNVICPYYNICGGCNFLHTTYPNERRIKLKYLEKLFDRKIDYLETNNVFFHRNKIVLHVNKGILGLYNDKTHDICQIDKCYLVKSEINDFITYLKSIDLTYVSEIMIRSIDDKILLRIKADKVDEKLKSIKCDSLYINDRYIKGDKYLVDEINGFMFSIYPDSFYQVNKEGMTNIYNKAYEYITRRNTLLDLYCGTGTIGIWLNKKFRKITGVEINESSIRNAIINKELNNLKNIEFICNDAKNIKGSFDSIVVDPPRSGLSIDVVNYLNKSKSREIVYISCNPNTLKRDIDLLTNYELNKISCCDMFPRTKHIECVCLLTIKDTNDTYKNTVVLTHGDYWYFTKGDGAYVLSFLTDYKLYEDPKNAIPTVSFPIDSLDKVIGLLRKNKINYYLKYEDKLVDYGEYNNFEKFLHHDLPFSYVVMDAEVIRKPKGSFKVQYEGEDIEEYVIGKSINEDAELTKKVVSSNVGDIIKINKYNIKIIEKNIS